MENMTVWYFRVRSSCKKPTKKQKQTLKNKNLNTFFKKQVFTALVLNAIVVSLTVCFLAAAE